MLYCGALVGAGLVVTHGVFYLEAEEGPYREANVSIA
jgi:hypothetical protein